MHGHWTTWHENGQKKSEGEYEKGSREGRWTYWNEDGSIDHRMSGIYKHWKIAELPGKKN